MQVLKCFIIVFFASLNLKGQCGYGLIIELKSQEDINVFINDYCTDFLGTLRILDDNDGMDNIIDLSPLSALSSVDGILTISNNNSLQSLNGLESLSFAGSVQIFSNPLLSDLNGLDSLLSTIGDLWISGNTTLTNLEGLNSIDEVGGVITISFNDKITSLDGLNNLTSTSGLRIHDNNLLSNIDAIANIDPSTITFNSLDVEDIAINNNPMLMDCSIDFICAALQIPELDSKIESNNVGCNSEEEVIALCTTFSHEIKADKNMEIYPNPFMEKLTIKTIYSNHIYIYDTTGQLLKAIMLKKGDNLLNLNDINKGVYLIVDEKGKAYKLVKL